MRHAIVPLRACSLQLQALSQTPFQRRVNATLTENVDMIVASVECSHTASDIADAQALQPVRDHASGYSYLGV